MVPSTEHVMKKRHHNRRRLRFLSLSLVLAGLIFSGWGAFNAMVDSSSAWQHYAAFGAALIAPAIGLWAFDGLLARALVPLPDARCPRCRYELILLERPRCPECGLPVPAAFLRPADQ